MRKEILAHFKNVDPLLSVLAQKISIHPIQESRDFFFSLCENIIGQQLGAKAADAIFTRFLKLFPDQKVSAKKLFAIRDETIRNVGTSWAKVRSLKDLAYNVIHKHINIQSLGLLSDEEVIRELTKVKGIGPWTADMFLMFSLAREDIFSFGDVGLQNAIQNLYSLRRKPTQKQLKTISRKWAPYRTYACLLLWESLDSDISL